MFQLLVMNKEDINTIKSEVIIWEHGEMMRKYVYKLEEKYNH